MLMVTHVVCASQRYSRHVVNSVTSALRISPFANVRLSTKPKFYDISNWALAHGGQGVGTKAAGLFGRPELIRPEDWQRLAHETEDRCES